MSGPIFEGEGISAHLTEEDEAYVLVADEAGEDAIRAGLKAVKELGFKKMNKIYYDATLKSEVMVFSR